MDQIVPPGGNHILLDIWGVSPEKLDDPKFVIATLKEAAIAAGATVLKEDFVKFEPEGVTAFLILAESHCSYHGWSSLGYASIDCFTCGSTDVDKAAEIIIDKFKPTKFVIQKIKRG